MHPPRQRRRIAPGDSPSAGKPLSDRLAAGFGTIVPINRGKLRARHFGKQAPDPIRLHRRVGIVQQPVKFIQFAAVFVARHIPPMTIGPRPTRRGIENQVEI
jgi:hypothetical protein